MDKKQFTKEELYAINALRERRIAEREAEYYRIHGQKKGRPKK